MKGATHLLAGLVLSALLIRFLEVPNPLLLVLLVLLGSLLPDIDERHSTIGRKVPIVGFFVKHRTFFHGLLFLVASVILLSFFIEPLYLVAYSLAFITHLLLDALTPMGVTPFWPSKLRMKGFVRVGGLLEKLVFVAFVILFVYLLLGRFW